MKYAEGSGSALVGKNAVNEKNGRRYKVPKLNTIPATTKSIFFCFETPFILTPDFCESQ